jgi:hypothetical protein
MHTGTPYNNPLTVPVPEQQRISGSYYSTAIKEKGEIFKTALSALL